MRYIDDWVVLAPTGWKLLADIRVVKQVILGGHLGGQVLHAHIPSIISD